MDVFEELRTSFPWHVLAVSGGVCIAAAVATMGGEAAATVGGGRKVGAFRDARFLGAFTVSLTVVAVIFTLFAGKLALPAPILPFAFIGALVGAGASSAVSLVCAMYAADYDAAAENAFRRVAPHVTLAIACAVTVMVVVGASSKDK